MSKNYIPKHSKPDIPKSQQNPNKKKQVQQKKFIIWLLVFSGIGVVLLAGVFAVVIATTSTQQPHAQAVAHAPPPPPRPSPTPTPTPEPTPDPMEGMVHSPLTGLPIPEENEFLRPVAVVVNNHTRALPQSGISQAEIIYEVLAEGNITCLVAIFQQLEAPKIGPVRSTRDYFVDFALDNDAVFIHHGGSPSGYARLRNLGVDRLDGMILEGTTFWRDPERRRIPALIEHSSFTGAEEIEAAIERHNFRRDRYHEDGIGFDFNLDELLSFEALARATGGVFQPVSEIVVPFSNGYPRRFVYDEDSGLFLVYNVHGPHIDAGLITEEGDESEAQIAVANVLVQNVRSRIVPGDEEGRREVNTVGLGTGYLATAGGIVNIKWERDSHTSPTRWYFVNGRPLQLTPGQIWINVLQDTAEIQVTTGLEPTDENGDSTDEE